MENAYAPSLGYHHSLGDTYMILLWIVPDVYRDSLEHVSEFLVADEINFKQPDTNMRKVVQMIDMYVETQMMRF